MKHDLPSDADDGWGISFAFWSTLLVAGALFASVALAPKLKTLAELKLRYAETQYRLVELERQTHELDRVVDALENDPAFAAELAKLEFSAGRRGHESISVSQELQLGSGVHSSAPSAAATPAAGSRWKVPATILSPLATHRSLRISILTAAAVLSAFALVVLNERHTAAVRGLVAAVQRMNQTVLQRYQRL